MERYLVCCGLMHAPHLSLSIKHLLHPNTPALRLCSVCIAETRRDPTANALKVRKTAACICISETICCVIPCVCV